MLVQITSLTRSEGVLSSVSILGWLARVCLPSAQVRQFFLCESIESHVGILGLELNSVIRQMTKSVMGFHEDVPVPVLSTSTSVSNRSHNDVCKSSLT